MTSSTAPRDQDRAQLAAAVRALVEDLAEQAVVELERYETSPRPGALEEAGRLLDEAAAHVRSLRALAHPPG